MFNTPEKPLTASVNDKEYPINRTFFFERSDGSVISCEEREAWNLYARRQQVLGVQSIPFKFIGSSDGKAFQKALYEAKQIMRETGDLEKAQQRIKDGNSEELEVAKLNKVPPRNMDKMGPGASELLI